MPNPSLQAKLAYETRETTRAAAESDDSDQIGTSRVGETQALDELGTVFNASSWMAASPASSRWPSHLPLGSIDVQRMSTRAYVLYSIWSTKMHRPRPASAWHPACEYSGSVAERSHAFLSERQEPLARAESSRQCVHLREQLQIAGIEATSRAEPR